MVTADSGEDSILFTKSGSYAANIEKAISLPSKEKPLENISKSLIHTPKQKSIQDICKINKLDPTQIVKVIIYLAKFENKSEVPLLVCIRGDQTINEVKVFNLIDKTISSNLMTLSLIESELVIKKNFDELPLGYLGPDLEDQLIKRNSTWEKRWISSLGALFMAISTIPFLINIFLSFKNGKKAGDNPWEALTPEWLTSSPPPVENWKGEAPLVTEPYGYGSDTTDN